MEALIVLAVLIIIAVPIILLIQISSLRSTMMREFEIIRKRLDERPKDIVLEKVIEKVAEKPVEKPAEKPIEIPKPVVVEPPAKEVEKIEVAFPKPEPPTPPLPPPPPKPKRPSFFERNPDLEKFIGENLANKIGIAILVIGIGFFVKYAIDQDWINEIGRVFIGISCGGILLGIAHYLRKKFTAFSSVLVGGGIAVLYLTIYIAYHNYGIFSPTVTFLLMVLITGFAVIFALAYDRVELAVVAILGGFASPLMASSGEGNYVALFIYITILDVGMMVLSFYKKWPLINIISYVFTVLLYGVWLSSQYDYQKPGMTIGALIFATVFYFVFFAMNLLNNLKERRPFKSLDFTLLLSNTAFYYAAGMYLLNNPEALVYRGLFTVLLAVFNFGFAYSLYKNSRVDKNLVFLLIGLVLTFISLAAPIQLNGHSITLFWAAETVLLLWLSQKSGIKLMKITSFAVMGLMVISLMMDLQDVYGLSYETPLNIIFNKGYLTSLVAVASFVLTLILLKKEDLERYRNTIMVAVVLLVYVMNLLELNYQVDLFYPFDEPLRVLCVGSYNMLFILALLLAEPRITKPGDVRSAFAFLAPLAVVIYIGYYYWESIDARYNLIIDGFYSAYYIHYIIVLLLIPICSLGISKIKHLTEFNIRTKNAYSWFYVAFFVFLASSELDNVVLLMGGNADNMDHLLTQNHKIGYPILWGVTSFLLIAIGLKMKLKHLRIISLTLFLVTLLKLFTVDIQGISEGGKIAAFISLGVLLLVVSFMYQRLKKILLFLAISTSVGLSANAQQYVAEAPLAKVDKSGFYEIPLSPRVTALMKDNFRNLRIVDEKGNEVPYLGRFDESEYENVEWKEFRIEKEIVKNCCTTITLLNETKSTIDNFILHVKNADVTKTAVLRGSDDKKTWYALKENFNLDFGRLNGKDVTEVFDFPSSDYAYYQLTINDSTTSPLNVVNAGQVATSVVRGRYVEIPAITFHSVDSVSDRATWVNLKLDADHFIDKLEFRVSGPRLYKREATVYLKSEYTDRKNRKHTNLEPIAYFEIISGQTPLVLAHARQDELLVRIDNGDNPALKVEEVHAYQLKRFVVAMLESGHDYKLAFENDLQAPVYDLEFFKDSIPSKLPVLEVTDVRIATQQAESSPTYFTNQVVIWIAIVVVIAILGFMSVRMLREKSLK